MYLNCQLPTDSLVSIGIIPTDLLIDKRSQSDIPVMVKMPAWVTEKCIKPNRPHNHNLSPT